MSWSKKEETYEVVIFSDDGRELVFAEDCNTEEGIGEYNDLKSLLLDDKSYIEYNESSNIVQKHKIVSIELKKEWGFKRLNKTLKNV